MLEINLELKFACIEKIMFNKKCLYCNSLIEQRTHSFSPYFCVCCNVDYHMNFVDSSQLRLISYTGSFDYDVDYHINYKQITIVKNGIFLVTLEYNAEKPQSLDDFKFYLNKFLKLRSFL